MKFKFNTLWLFVVSLVTVYARDSANPEAFWRSYHNCTLARLQQNLALFELEDLVDATRQIQIECSDQATQSFYNPSTAPPSPLVSVSKPVCETTRVHDVYQTLNHCQLQSALHEWCTSLDAPTQLACFYTEKRTCRKIKTSLIECFCA